MNEKTLKKRSDIPDSFKWKMEDMFASDELWEKELKELEALADKAAKMEGTIGESAANLLAFAEINDELEFHFNRVFVYANQKSHEDTSVSKYQSYTALADAAAVKVAAAVSFADPEILAIPEDKLEAFYKEEPKLEAYRRMISEILRKKAHTLTPAEEAILAETGELAVAADNLYSIFSNADLKFPSVTDVEGNRIQITHGNFTSLLESKDREFRKEVFKSLYSTYKKWGNTIATNYANHLKQDRFYAKVRKYNGTRSMYLDNGNIPESVYDNLIETVHKFLPAMHRYMAMRKKLLGVERLHMYDIYVPVVDDFEKVISYDEAKETVLKGLAPMGEEYVGILKEGFGNGWIDVYENENKRSGAYSWGAYGTHPYVLLNHQDNLNCMFTLAHEMGHALHTYYSNQNQPVTYAGYLIFVAEVASTCNESLLMQYLLKNCEEGKEKQFLLNHYLESFRTTLFRQTMFAEFEKIAHQTLAEKGSVTKEELNQIYHDLNAMYYGEDVVIDEEIDWEWMRIPHFYTSFYVYQYATGYSAAIAFSKKILEEGQSAVDQYVKEFLSGGCSKDPIDLLKNAGVDMSTAKPVEDALKVFEDCIEQFEKAF